MRKKIWRKIRNLCGATKVEVVGYEVVDCRWDFGILCGGVPYLMQCYFRRPGCVQWFLSTADAGLVVHGPLPSLARRACVAYLNGLARGHESAAHRRKLSGLVGTGANGSPVEGK